MIIEPAYLAGVADADGSFSISIKHKDRKNPYYRPVFQLTWTFTETSLKIMEAMKELYGGSYFIQTEKRPSFKNGKPTIKYSLDCQQLLKFLNDVEPYIKLKQMQVQNLKKIIASTPKIGSKNKSQELITYQHNLYLSNKTLNGKNTGDRRTL